MPPEPPLEHQRILAALSLNYGLDVSHLTYLNVGTAHAYRAEGAAGHYFVKLLPNNTYGQEMLQRVKAELPLLNALREQNVLPRVPEVLPTLTGDGLTWIDGFALLVYHWIDAQNVEGNWENFLPELLPLLGRLHAGTPRLLPAVPRLPMPPEDFAFPFQSQFNLDLQVLWRARHHERMGVRDLHNLLFPYREQLDSLLVQAAEFQALARQQEHDFVVCHTDAHGWNVMRDQAGQLWIIDWETARLAPPEHDLWMMAAHLPELLPSYEATLGRRLNLSLHTLSFYLCRRVLEDLAMDVNLILHANTRPEQDTANLNIIEKYILPDLNDLKERLKWLTSIPGVRP